MVAEIVLRLLNAIHREIFKVTADGPSYESLPMKMITCMMSNFSEKTVKFDLFQSETENVVFQSTQVDLVSSYGEF